MIVKLCSLNEQELIRNSIIPQLSSLLNHFTNKKLINTKEKNNV